MKVPVSLIFIFGVYLLLGCAPKASPPLAPSSEHSAPDTTLGATSEAGGQGSTGGGGGVACFTSQTEAAIYVAKDGTIPIEHRDKIIKLYFLDFESQWQDPLEPLANETSKEMLNRIIEEKIKPLNRVFANRLQKSVQLLDIDHWHRVTSLPIFNDTNPKFDASWDKTWISKLKNKPGCVPVQIALRHSKSNGNKSPQINVDVDVDYFKRLLTMNSHNQGIAMQAALYLHEALYVIAAELGEVNSENVRYLTGDLFFKGTWKNETRQKFLLTIYKDGFNYFSSAFSGDYPSVTEKQLNLEAYQSLNKKKSAAIKSVTNKSCRPDQLFQTIYLISNNSSAQADDQAKCDWVQSSMMTKIVPLLSARESFIATAEEAFNNAKIESFDALFATDENSTADITTICNYAFKNSSDKNDLHLQKIFQMTNQFCSTLNNIERSNQGLQ